MTLKIEVLSFAGCPHREETVTRARDVVSALGVRAEVCEVEVRDDADAGRLRFPGSPTVRIDGIDVEPIAERNVAGALSCRMYGTSGVPSRELLASAIATAASQGRGAGRGWLPAAGIPAAALAALPSCPACYPLYAGILSSLGLTLDPGAHLALMAGLLAVALVALGFRARARRGYAPLALGTLAALLVAVGKLALGSEPVVYAGAAVLAAAGIWNAWPPRARSASCSACIPGEVTT